MIEDISSPMKAPRPSWNDRGSPTLRNERSLIFYPATDTSRADRALMVYQIPDKKSAEPVVHQLLAKARIVLPAVMNYLFFSSAQVAVVYFGKRVGRKGEKIGVAEGARDLKIRLVRYFTTEMWPSLLRTDAPDESLGGDLLHENPIPNANEDCAPENVDLSISESGNLARIDMEVARERSWFLKSVENHMQVLLYLKRSTDGKTEYLKVILQNTMHRLHFDVVSSREEKYRWDLRMLFIRLMDNLETQKAIDSYESYERFFREACEFAGHHSSSLERPMQPMLNIVIWGGEGSESAENGKGLHRIGSRGGLASEEVSVVLDNSLLGDECRPDGGEGSLPAISLPPAFTRPFVITRRCSSKVVQLKPREQVPTISPQLAPHSQCTRHIDPSAERYYDWMINLEKPESTTLDYKSYFFQTAKEIQHRCVKFMCGFLNAYGQGKLVVGVHEIARSLPGGPIENRRNDEDASDGNVGPDTIVQHNDLIDQYVVGSRITRDELMGLQASVSEQLLSCIPPIPPHAVQVDAVPVRFPVNFSYAESLLVLYDFGIPYVQTRDTLKQKSNYAIRFLFSLGLAIVPVELADEEFHSIIEANEARQAPEKEEDQRSDAGEGLGQKRWLYLQAEAYMIAAIADPAALKASKWETKLNNALTKPRQRCRHSIVAYDRCKSKTMPTPSLYVVEVSVDIKRCTYPPLRRYTGKFFAGWPSIPIWDPTTRTVRGVERNYNIFNHPGSAMPSEMNSMANLSPVRVSPSEILSTTKVAHGKVTAKSLSATTPSTLASGVVPFTGRNFQRFLVSRGWAWFTNPHILALLLQFLYNTADIDNILQFRLIHPMSNSVFENLQGVYLVHMIRSTPVGAPDFAVPASMVSRVQYAFLNAGLPPLPLLLTRIYELIGNLPSPYPFVAVPLVQQTFRVAPRLIPLLYRQHYFDGQLRLAVVLDLQDSYIKTVELKNGNLILDTVVGMGFEPVNKRQVLRHFIREEEKLRHQPPGRTMDGLASKEEGHQLRQSFLARRPFHVGGLTESSESQACRSNTLSPLLDGSINLGGTHVVPREIEADIPLIHFRFLTRSIVMESNILRSDEMPKSWGAAGISPVGVSPKDPGSPSDSSIAASVDSFSEEADPTFQRALGRPWTLQHLLSWYGAFLVDAEHYRVFGYGDRSTSFYVETLQEVCTKCVESGAVEAAVTHVSTHREIQFADGPATCTLHRKMRAWMAV